MTPVINAEYAAKGWPSIDPRSPAYCYRPCRTGLHVCGFHPDDQNFLTIANLPTRDAAAAEALFARAEAELAVAEGEDGDLVIDLQLNGDCERDFSMSRQMLERLIAMGGDQ